MSTRGLIAPCAASSDCDAILDYGISDDWAVRFRGDWDDMIGEIVQFRR
jgi:hypothetical protein